MTLPHSWVLRAQLSQRIRQAFPREWSRFTGLWLSFNAIYGGEPDAKERRRVMAAIRRHLSQARARQVLQASADPLQRILSIPPGDMRLDERDPTFRRASRALARKYWDRSCSQVDRLAAVGGVLYQVRCNLLHGSKDPRNDRDRMLVEQSIRVLECLVPALEEGASQL